MKKKVFNFVFALSILTIVFCTMNSVSAQTIHLETKTYKDDSVITTVEENVGVCPNKRWESEFSTNGLSKPSEKWDLKKEGKYDFSGNAAKEDLYTNYLFTGVTEIRVKLHATKYQPLNAELWQRRTKLFQSDVKVATFNTVEVGYSSETTLFGLDSSANYYIKFIAPAYFTGWIESNN